MVGRLGTWRHFLVLISIGGCSALAYFGFIGGGNSDERFDAKQVTVSPTGENGVRIREVVDEDFGSARRHGYERTIPHNFGAPTDIRSSSPNANAELGATSTVYDGNPATRIRLGDPDTTYQGQHRYTLTYTLPSAGISSGTLNLNIINAGEKFETGRFEVILTGFVLSDTTCKVGGTDRVDGCTLVKVGDDYRVVFTPLHKGDGITVGGTIAGLANPTLPAAPGLPVYRANHRTALAEALVPIGLVAAIIVLVIAEIRGRNEVFSGGPAEAAYGGTGAPRSGGGNPSTSLVSDARLEALATTEFVPPKGIDPWQGAVLLRERIDDATVSAWFSALAASEAITLTQQSKHLVIGVGRRRGELDPSNAAIVNALMSDRAEVTLGSYDPHFATAWKTVKAQQGTMIAASGWWKRRAPSPDSGPASIPVAILIVAALLLVFVGGAVVSPLLGFLGYVWVAILFGLLVPAFVAYCVYATLLPVRSASGSALTVLTESFRRFLDASEGQHVEWAWQHGLLREYSAWAVALGAADAWGNALERSNVPPIEYASVNPLLVYSMASSFSSSHTAPSSSSGGGSSGGGFGGGGGGGSSGSW